MNEKEKDLPMSQSSMENVSISKSSGEIGAGQGDQVKTGVSEESVPRISLVDRSAVEVMEKEGEVGVKMDPKTGTSLMNPFLLFPEEVWENILERLPHSTDIDNVFKAVPGLEGHVLKNKYAWLFDQVVPFLHPWLGLKELLNCRGVNKRWRQGVDNHLENHPIQTAVAHHENEASGHRWCTETGETYRKWECFGHRQYLDEPDKMEALSQFQVEMGKLPATQNPFVGRAVAINLVWGDEPLSWSRSLEILEKFGSHIWFLKLGITHDDDLLQVCQIMLDVLWLVPNLKMLDIHASIMLELEDEGGLEAFAAIKEFLPSLPFLETLTTCDWDMTAALIGRLLAVHYSTQIKRLYISQLREEHLDIFPGLTELTLSGTTFLENAEATQTIRSLGAPELQTLCLTLRDFDDAEHGLSWNEVVSWLQPFKKIQSFHFNTDNFLSRFQRVTIHPGIIEPIASLKSLTVRTSGYEFELDDLPSLFPSLEYINIIGHVRAHVPACLRNQEKIMNNTTVWERLPTLQQIILADSEDASITRRRTRAGAEMLKSQRAHPTNPHYLENIFEDFDSMVLGTWGEEHREEIEAVVELDEDGAVAGGQNVQVAG